jgi:CRP/FNR family cyclic AMP-dependent transcriptional regulator
MKTLATAVSLPGFSTTEEENTPSRLLGTLIAEQPFFKGLSAEYVKLLADSAIEIKFEPGQAIFEAGSPANRFYLILEGKVSLESEAKEHGSIIIQTLGPGEDLGWAWLFPPYALHFSARALAPTRTIFFYGTRLREQCEQDHELGYQLMKRTAEAATGCLRAMQQRLLECINPDKLQQ